MAVYSHPHEPRLRVAYTWLGTRVPTPRWFDDPDHSLYHRRPWIGRRTFTVWAWFRSVGIVQVRYWGRA